jgi:hypothetical protein
MFCGDDHQKEQIAGTDPFETLTDVDLTCNPGAQSVIWHGVSPSDVALMCTEGSTVLRIEEPVHDLLAATAHRGVKLPRRVTPSVFPVNLGLRSFIAL